MIKKIIFIYLLINIFSPLGASIKEKIIFVCQMGVRSALACEISSAYGVDEDFLFNLEGGMNEWITNGFKVE